MDRIAIVGGNEVQPTLIPVPGVSFDPSVIAGVRRGVGIRGGERRCRR